MQCINTGTLKGHFLPGHLYSSATFSFLTVLLVAIPQIFLLTFPLLPY